MNRCLVMLLVAGLLAGGSSVSAQGDIIGDTRAAITQGDLVRAEAIARAGIEADPAEPVSLEALSWVGRGALAAGDLNLALTVARDTRALAEAALDGRSPDVDRNLEIALGAAIEVQALVTAERGDRSDAVYLLERAIEQYGGSDVHARLQKNAHLLGLTGQPAPALDTSEFLGTNRATLDHLRGSPVVLFFWAHWCPDCKAQGPSIERLLDDFGDQGLRVVAPTMRYGYTESAQVSAPPGIEQAHIDTVQREFYPYLRNVPMPLAAENFRRYGVSSTPTLVVVDAEGLVQLYNPGNIDEESLRRVIRGLLPSGS